MNTPCQDLAALVAVLERLEAEIPRQTVGRDARLYSMSGYVARSWRCKRNTTPGSPSARRECRG